MKRRLRILKGKEPIPTPKPREEKSIWQKLNEMKLPDMSPGTLPIWGPATTLEEVLMPLPLRTQEQEREQMLVRAREDERVFEALAAEE